jgi:two-component system, chemotaxis family, protein-glutamate methylesterase/glutaminase
MRILIAEDDEALAKFVRQGLEGERYSVDVLPDGEQARAAAIQFDYDVVILDLNLPKLDGLSVLRYLRSKKPSLPVLVLTQRTRVEDRVQCLDTGADDYIPKHLAPGSLDIEHIRQDLLVKIRAAAESRKSHSVDVPCRKPPRFSLLKSSDTVSANAPAIVVVGTSTGGPKALQEMLPLFPRDLSVPVLIVQHLPPGFTGAFAQRMNSLCSLTVREATQGERIQAGVVYIAPAGVHMTVLRPSDSQAMIWLDTHPEDCSYIPSVDVLMKSVAETFGNEALGVIMTGMGSDGAEGIKAIHRAGGVTIGQDEASCTVFSMPRACAELGLLSCVVPLLEIPAQILHATHYRKSASKSVPSV